MKGIHRTIIFCLMIILAFTSLEVGAKVISPKLLKKKAESAVRIGNLNEAIQLYTTYLKTERKDNDAKFNLAELYRKTRNYDQAIELYVELCNLRTNKYKDAHYQYGVLLMTKGDFENALRKFNYVKRNSRGLSNKTYRLRLKSLIKSCEEKIEGVDPNYSWVIHAKRLNGDVNAEHMDMAVFPLNDSSFLFTSYREEDSDNIAILENRERPVKAIYLAKNTNQQWYIDHKLEELINAKSTHTESPCYNKARTRMYFTRTRLNWKEEYISEIFVQEYIDSQWQIPRKLPYPVNSEHYSNTHPNVSFDSRSGRELVYFSSNRKGGRGGKDIWLTTRKNNGEYTKPRNLGPKINTSGDEITPFYHEKEHQLYFSSDGFLTLGGKDIFKSRGAVTKWKQAERLPSPINSPYDDTHPALLAKELKGYFASNRPKDSLENTCCEDLFAFEMQPTSVRFLEGSVYNQQPMDYLEELESKFDIETPLVKLGDPLPKVKIELFETDSEGEEYLIAETETDIEGKYNFITEPGKLYKLKIHNYDLEAKNLKVDTRDISETDSLLLQPVGLNYLISDLNLKFDIYFEHDKSHLNEQARSLIDTSLYKVIKLIPNAKFEIGAHTDNTGKENYNLKLSQKRATSVFEYLTQKGIIKDRLIAKGYGEALPIANNQNEDGSDNPEGRRLNRRTEIKIIGSFNLNCSKTQNFNEETK